MKADIVLPAELAGQIEHILEDLHSKTKAECVLLADVSGQLISKQGQTKEIDPTTVATLAASDMAALSELVRQVGEKNPHGSFLHEGENKSIYLFNVAGSFILIVIFRADTPIGLMRLFVRRTAERLYPLTVEFEDVMGQPMPVAIADFSAMLADELDQAFAGL